MLRRILVQRFGEVPPVIAAHMETLTIEQVETLVDTALAAETLEKFLDSLSDKMGELEPEKEA